MSGKYQGNNRTDRARKKKLLKRKQNQKLQKSAAFKTASLAASDHTEGGNQAEGGNQVESTQLRQLVKDNQTGSGNFEIVVYKPSAT